MALASVDDREASLAAGLEQSLSWLNRGLNRLQVTALDCSEAVSEEKVALHVDDQQRSMPGFKGKGVGLCVDRDRANRRHLRFGCYSELREGGAQRAR